VGVHSGARKKRVSNESQRAPPSAARKVKIVSRKLFKGGKKIEERTIKESGSQLEEKK